MREAIAKLAERVANTYERIETEEATKNAYIMPFIQMLGYDIFDPTEVVPEFTADVGIKKGEKVDYAICRDGEPVILIECKSCRSTLSLDNESQLFRYFHTTKAHFALLTNGIEFRFYTDLEEPNKMDSRPFLEFTLHEPDKVNCVELAKFCKANFNEESIRRTADMLKCATSIRSILKQELSNPSEEFVRLIFKKMEHGKVFTDKVKEKFTPLVKSSLDAVISERVKANLSDALNATAAKSEEHAAPAEEQNNNGIVTTQEEIDAYNIIRAILRAVCTPDQVVIRDAKSYCAVLFDDNNRKPICRLYFNSQKKKVGLFDGENEETVQIQDVDDLFQLADRLVAAAQKYKK